MSKKWMSSGCLQAAPKGAIDHEKGIIEGVSVCTAGEAKGHGVSLDSEFIQTVARLGAERKQGLKVRFGHPSMCSTALGTFLGRLKNFSTNEDETQVYADLFLSNEAKITPQGDLHSYVLGLAANEPDMFGTSIVFQPGREYQRDEDGNKVFDINWNDDVFVECDSLFACDAVDDPAANDGLFSAWASETIAGQLSEFMDLHPQVFEAIEQNPSIVEALARHGDKMDSFITSYRQYRKHAKEADMPKETTTSAEALEEAAAVEQPIAADEPVKVENENLTAEPVAEPVAESAPVEDAPEELSRDEFTRIADEFGAEIAVQTVKDGGDYNSALTAHAASLKAENVELKARIVELEADDGQPAVVTEAKEKKSLFKKNR
jgi:hypothetical protein